LPVAPQPSHNLGESAEHRMNLTVRHMRTIGCEASGLISDEEDLVKAVLTEIRSWDYAAVLLVTGRQRGSWLGGHLHIDPVHRLRRRLGPRLVVFPLGPGAPRPTLSS
jgi:hypothetical protein